MSEGPVEACQVRLPDSRLIHVLSGIDGLRVHASCGQQGELGAGAFLTIQRSTCTACASQPRPVVDPAAVSAASYEVGAPAYVDRALGDWQRPWVNAYLDLFLGDGHRSFERLLSVGSGGPAELAALAPHARTLIGLDRSWSLLEAAASSFGRLAHADARALPFADGSFDGVWSSGVLHHLPKDGARAAFAEARRVLSADGRFFIALHAGTRAVLLDGPIGVRPFFLWLRDEFLEALAGAGLVPERVLVDPLPRCTWLCVAGVAGPVGSGVPEHLLAEAMASA